LRKKSVGRSASGVGGKKRGGRSVFDIRGGGKKKGKKNRGVQLCKIGGGDKNGRKKGGRVLGSGSKGKNPGKLEPWGKIGPFWKDYRAKRKEAAHTNSIKKTDKSREY